MAEASIETRAMVAAEEINARIEMFYEGNDHSAAGIMSCKDAVRNILTECNLTYKMQMPPECCGVHSDNRAGQGLIPADVHELLGRVFGGGVVRAAMRGAMLAS